MRQARWLSPHRENKHLLDPSFSTLLLAIEQGFLYMSKVGRPLKYKTVDELQKAIDEYFDYCDNRIQQVYSAKADGVIEVIDPAPYTMSGLARHLGLSRQALIDYKNKDEFLDTIKAAREKVHEDVETRLMEKQATGAIFNLKNNFGWRDKTETENTGDINISIKKI